MRHEWKNLQAGPLVVDGIEYRPEPFSTASWLYTHAYRVGKLFCCFYDREVFLEPLQVSSRTPDLFILSTSHRQWIGIEAQFKTSPEHVIRGTCLVDQLLDWDLVTGKESASLGSIIPDLIKIDETHMGAYWDYREVTGRWLHECMARLVQMRKVIRGEIDVREEAAGVQREDVFANWSGDKLEEGEVFRLCRGTKRDASDECAPFRAHFQTELHQMMAVDRESLCYITTFTHQEMPFLI